MKTNQLHSQAMEHSDEALVARLHGDFALAVRHLNIAMEMEAEAADTLMYDHSAEPSRSVLYRSAATLANECERFDEAERLIYKALSGVPPVAIAEELRDLLEQISFARHLKLRGITLGEEEIQLAITGDEIGFGVAPTDLVLSRVRSTEDLLYRTAERKFHRPYRDSGRKKNSLLSEIGLFMTVPRAACFAVTFKVGRSEQFVLPGMSAGEQIVDEMFDCLELFVNGNEASLRGRFDGVEEAYFRNFIGLAGSLQPDGNRLSMVGFTATRRGRTRQLAMKRPLEKVISLKPTDVASPSRRRVDPKEETVTVIGQLLLANAIERTHQFDGEIKIISDGGSPTRMFVPPGMMNDIVRPLWESQVTATGIKKGRKIILMQVKEI